ncbi:hypothetical protein HALLA_12070 [Halostagnicola larsenii XH-48]|uniref:Major capsid protein n=1 Tax=Halostagnicola larsenii XH-48 TaxID=797299 RepID=W0JQF7_9EURY|nr:phage major capsid protein [Halostagnicola larsenii]AHG00961.1 hypothetical protein HALLA_12070 [Halostagnicola larsenii XH-48]
MAAPVSQGYSPAAHDGELGNTHEESVARTLARKEFNEDDQERFLSGDATMDKDQYIQRALLNDSVTELDVLFREELETTIIQGAQPRKIFRDAAFIHNATKRKGDIPRVTDESHADVIAQGAEIETGQDGFDTVSFDCQKVARGFEISDEIINESEPDVVEQLAREAGAAVENTINRFGLVNLVDGAGQSFDADVGGTTDASAVQALNGGATEVDMQDFGEANAAIVHPRFEKAIFDDTNVVYANRGGSTEPLQDRQMGSIMGMERWKGSHGTYNGADDTKTLSPDGSWNYQDTDDIGAVAYNRDLFALVLWDDMDLVTKDWEDPIRDLQGSNVRSYVDAVWRQEDGGATVTHSTA